MPAIAPADFVPVAEHAGLMKPLGEFVLRQALSDAKRWPGLYISVNLSPVQVRDPAMVSLVAQVLAENELPASRVLLEVTEGVLIDDPKEAKARLGALQALGVRIALDDFGTGYSSLSYLKNFPVTTLKIDRSFIADVTNNPDDAATTTAIIALAKAMELDVVAEGVEREDQAAFLRERGCHKVQGYLVGRPAPAEVFVTGLRRAESPEISAEIRAVG